MHAIAARSVIVERNSSSHREAELPTVQRKESARTSIPRTSMPITAHAHEVLQHKPALVTHGAKHQASPKQHPLDAVVGRLLVQLRALGKDSVPKSTVTEGNVGTASCEN